MSEDKIIFQFDSILLEIRQIENSIENNLQIDELKELCFRINILANGIASDLNLLKKYCSYFNDEDCDHYTIYSSINKIIFKNNFRSKIDIISAEEKSRRESLKGINALADAVGRNLLGFGKLDVEEAKLLIDSFTKKDEAVTFIQDSIKSMFIFLNDIVITPLNYFTTIKPLEEYDNLDPDKISAREMEYYQSWVDLSITIPEWKRYSLYNFRAYLRLKNFDFDILEKIELHQTNLFNKEVQNRVKSLIDDVFDLQDQFKKNETIKMHLYLLEKFFSGNADNFTIERIKEIQSFYYPKKVLLHYDEILKSDYFDYDEMHIFQPKKNRKYSSLFSACVLFEYFIKLKTLNFNKEKKAPVSVMKNTKSFHFVYDDFSLLKDKLSKINLLLDLFVNDEMFEDFCSLLQSEDFTVDKFKIVINCETIQFSYIIRELQIYFKNLRPVTLERCGSLFTKTRSLKPLKQGDIKPIPPTGVKLKEKIDKIFKEK
jgi:hypothetical protein